VLVFGLKASQYFSHPPGCCFSEVDVTGLDSLYQAI